MEVSRLKTKQSNIPVAFWNAIKECDSEYDGKFYYGVETTGIFAGLPADQGCQIKIMSSSLKIQI